jgi:hypothetical protein
MKKVIIILNILVFAACVSENKTIVNEQLNLIITPDLSNRIEDVYSKPVSDISLIKSIYNSYYPDLYRIKGRVIGQKDVIQVRFTNPTIINEFEIDLDNLKIDLRNMKPIERIDFLTKGKYRDMLKNINIEVNALYEKAKRNITGGDIFNYLKKELTSSLIKKPEVSKQVNGNTIINKQRNIIVLLTDGYIEAGLYGENNCVNKRCLYLSKLKVDQFRKEFLASGNSDLKDFFTKSGYGIVPIKNKNLESTEVFVAEMYDRSLHKKTGSQTVSPNDFEILTVFWSDWLEKSGVKHYKLLDTSNSKEEFLLELSEFIKEV